MTERVSGVAGLLSLEESQRFGVVGVRSFIEIPKLEPFLNGSNLSVVMDMDGVLCGRGKENTFESNIEKLRSLREISRKSKEIMFCSSRRPESENSYWWKIFGSAFERQSITTFPFLTEESMKRLFGYIRSCNPNCNVYFNLRNNHHKERGENGKNQSKEFYDFCFRALRQNRKLVVIGSNIFDKKEAQKMARVTEINGYDKNTIFCFNTGHWLI